MDLFFNHKRLCNNDCTICGTCISWPYIHLQVHPHSNYTEGLRCSYWRTFWALLLQFHPYCPWKSNAKRFLTIVLSKAVRSLCVRFIVYVTDDTLIDMICLKVKYSSYCNEKNSQKVNWSLVSEYSNAYNIAIGM